MKPDVSVLMPVHNGGLYIRDAIDSLLSQTYDNFELLIVDDASQDRTNEIIEQYHDPRIRIIRNRIKQGLARIRQQSVKAARGTYIAFLDADDLARKDRLEKQVAYLEQHPETDIVGSWVDVIDENGFSVGKIWKHATSSSLIPIILLFRNCMTQSSVMLRFRCLPKISFRSEYWAAPDYDLWLRLAPEWQFVNIPQTLVSYRVFSESMSFQKAAQIEQCTRRITRCGLEKFGITPSDHELTIQELFERCDKDFPVRLLHDALSWCNRLIHVNGEIHRYDRSHFHSVIANYWFKICCAKADVGKSVYELYCSAEFSLHGKGNKSRRSILGALTILKKKKIIDVTSQDWLRWNT